MGRYQCRKEAARRFTPPKPTTKSEIRAGKAQYRNDRDNDRAGEIVTELSPTLDAKALLEIGKGMVVEVLKHEKVAKPKEAEGDPKKVKPRAKGKDVEKKQAGAETREDILKKDDHSRDFNSEEGGDD